MLQQSQICLAIQKMRDNIQWRPGSAIRHLKKRKLRGHLPETATLLDYEYIILTVLTDKMSQVYRYWYKNTVYIAVVGIHHGLRWLVMFDYDGILESAFVVERPERYLKKPGFEWIGLLSEVNNEL